MSDPAPHVIGLSPKALGGLTTIITSVVAASNVAAAMVAIISITNMVDGEGIVLRSVAKHIVPRCIHA